MLRLHPPSHHVNRPDLADGMPEDEVVELGCHTEVLLHRVSELLSHGDRHDRRGALADAVPGLVAEDPGVLALVETGYDAKEWGRRHAARREEEGGVAPYMLDAKREVSRHLARHEPVVRPEVFVGGRSGRVAERA
jgi:hypothetical protein